MKKLRYDRILLVVSMILIVLVSFFLFSQMSRDRVYEGQIQTMTATYRQNSKIYSFELKVFEEDGQNYISLNDIYNVISIIDRGSHVYLDENRHVMIYELKKGKYNFYYGKDKIVYNNISIDTQKYNSHIYISHKNVYINVYFIEKYLLNSQKKIKIKNKTATIQ